MSKRVRSSPNYALSTGGDVDSGLAILRAITPKGYHWKQVEIAEIIGCSKGAISNLEIKALKRARQLMRELVLREEYSIAPLKRSHSS